MLGRKEEEIHFLSNTLTFALDYFVETGTLLEEQMKREEQLNEINDKLLAAKENVRIVSSEKEKLKILYRELKEKLQQGKINK